MADFKLERTGRFHTVTVPGGSTYRFVEEPSLPLSLYGRAETIGWDIPNYWAIDAEGQCWLDASGHGFGMSRVTLARLLSEVTEDGTDQRIREKLDLKPRLPEWMGAALSSGWTPPPTWKASDYSTGTEEQDLKNARVPREGKIP
jgi:hypothetical protein